MKNKIIKLHKINPELAHKVAKVLGYKIINSSLNLKIGDYVIQKTKSFTNYGYAISPLKGKGFKGIVINDDRKKAIIKTISDKWFPLPKKIKESEVPPKLLAKIKAKIKSIKK